MPSLVKALHFLSGTLESYLLYLGDTGADAIEGSDNLERLWHAISPLIDCRESQSHFCGSFICKRPARPAPVWPPHTPPADE